MSYISYKRYLRKWGKEYIDFKLNIDYTLLLYGPVNSKGVLVVLFQVLLSIFLFDWKSARIQFGLWAESYARGNTGRMSLIGLSGLYVGRFVSLSIWPLVMTCHLFISCRLLMS